MTAIQHNIFYVCEFIKTESATAVQRAFRFRFNIQPPTRKNICCWNHQFLILKYRLTKLSPSFWITLYMGLFLSIGKVSYWVAKFFTGMLDYFIRSSTLWWHKVSLSYEPVSTSDTTLYNYVQESTNFPKILEPLPNSRRQKRDV
jgi:hypothetical protein